MAEWWKLKREIGRVGMQLHDLVDSLRAPLRRNRYDTRMRSSNIRTQGDLPPSDTMAIILIYQPDGLLKSLFWQLKHFRQKSITPIIIANHNISLNDRARLAPLCHLMIERPNLGYDFGGYREGVCTLFDLDLRPKTLFVLNDSVWFPLNANCSLLDDARHHAADIYGIFYNTKNTLDRHKHLQSYFYRFGAKVLADPAFEQFWRALPLYSSKRQVVRNCEVKLAGKLSDHGYSISARFVPQDIVTAAAALSDSQISDIARFHATTTQRGRSIFRKLAAISPSDPGWTDARTQAIEESRFRYYFIDAHPLIFLDRLQSPFLKKSREFHFHAQRQEVLKMGLHQAFDPLIASEVVDWDRAGKVGPPERPEFARTDN